MHFRGAAHSGDPAQVGHEGDALRVGAALTAEPASHQRTEPVGADRQPRADRRMPAIGSPHERAGHGAPVVEQRLDPGALPHLRPGLASGRDQSGVEDPAREGKSGGAERRELGFAEEPREPAAAGADDGGALQGHGAC